jgi:hypothetical protein
VIEESPSDADVSNAADDNDDEDAEFGVAAHWHYDEKGSRRPAKDIKWVK